MSEQMTLSRLGTPLLRAHDASTFLARLRGLHGVPPLGPDEALVLRPCRAVQTFGMKAAIDVVFVDAQGMVLEVVTLAPGRTASRLGAEAVVEMRAGTAKTLRLVPGQQLVASNGAWSMTRSARRIAPLIAALIAACALGACASAPPERLAPGTASASPYTDDVFLLSGEADRAYRESRWLEAARKYRELTEAVPLDAYAWFRLGNTYAQQGDFHRAIAAYESSLERDATQAKPWFNLSTAYLLKAQTAMMKAWAQLREGDPARAMIETRLDALRTIVHERIEDGATRTSIR